MCSRLCVIVFILCSALTEGAQAQRFSENCYPYKEAHVSPSANKISIREEANILSARIRFVDPGEVLKVLQYKYTTTCWIQTTAGWMIYDRISISGTPFENTASQSKEDTEPRCFLYRFAYITGSMNIRNNPNPRGAIVTQSQRGDYYQVAETKNGDSWCWMRITGGWMAVTESVSNDIRDILPPITGEDWLEHKVTQAFKYISVRSPEWFEYTLLKIRKVIGDETIESAAGVIASTGVVQIFSGDYIRHTRTAVLAGTLIHEACHIHQWDRGMRVLINWEAEKECYGIEALALSHIASGDPHIEWALCMSEKYPFQALCE